MILDILPILMIILIGVCLGNLLKGIIEEPEEAINTNEY